MKIYAALGLFALLQVQSVLAQSISFQASPISLPGSSGEMAVISPAGAIAGVAYGPARRVFVLRGYSTEIIPLDESAHCTPQAANEVNGRTVVAGTCGTDHSSVWYWNGESVRILNDSMPYTQVTGISAAGIVAGNFFPPEQPVNPAVLWNGTDGSLLMVNGGVYGQYTTGISSGGLVGLSPRPATYSIQSDQASLLPFPAGQWSTAGSNHFSMSADGTLTGTLEAGAYPRIEHIIAWRSGAIQRQIVAPAACTYPNYFNWVSTNGNLIYASCRDGFAINHTVHVTQSNGTFSPLRSLVSGLPVSGELSVSRHISSSGVLVGQVTGDPRIWRITPNVVRPAKQALITCTDDNC